MMISIPGEIIALLTFPGVIMHEISHRLMCDIFKIPVYEVNYFNMGSKTVGYVKHHPTNNLAHTLWVGLAPLFFNSILCMLFTFPFNAALYITGESIPTFFNTLLWWVGISLGANAFPSNQDIANALSIVEENNFSKLHFYIK